MSNKSKLCSEELELVVLGLIIFIVSVWLGSLMERLYFKCHFRVKIEKYEESVRINIMPGSN